SPASSGGMTPASSGRMSPSQPMTEINEVQDNSADNISSRYPEPQIPSYMSSSSLLTDMNSSGTPDSGDSRGWLSASLAAADNTIPIGDALVLVSDDNNNLLSILISNDSGKTRSIAVSTPSKAVSETPSSAIPYSSYNMNVFKKGYYEVVMQNISVFPDTESIQLVNMVPLPFANPFDTLVFPQTETGQ
ncbi:MAG: hypothetical protein Q4F95_12125, partial [Oscillospiraceae bacterium]|nr:hypothetical protein [Oscillospiraceae bacterium]